MADRLHAICSLILKTPIDFKLKNIQRKRVLIALRKDVDLEKKFFNV